jgi:hypothetical protein
MLIGTDPSFHPRRTPTAALRAGEELQECDFCGRAVSPATSFRRARVGVDGVEVVVLCRECELGTD